MSFINDARDPDAVKFLPPVKLFTTGKFFYRRWDKADFFSIVFGEGGAFWDIRKIYFFASDGVTVVSAEINRVTSGHA